MRVGVRVRLCVRTYKYKMYVQSSQFISAFSTFQQISTLLTSHEMGIVHISSLLRLGFPITLSKQTGLPNKLTIYESAVFFTRQL